MELVLERIRVALPWLSAFLLAAETASAQYAPSPDGWKALADIPDAYIQDLSFVSAKVGYAAAGNSQILKTIDGGVTWSPVLAAGYHWYGVHALSADDVVVSGFINSGVQQALLVWTHDGGFTWSDPIVLSASETNYVWANRVHFWTTPTVLRPR